ncbi:hypothetical protein B0A55_12359, partial [Friedmanniomyces simplex]
MPTASLYDLSAELILQVNRLAHDEPKESTSYIATTRPAPNSLSLVSKLFRQLIHEEYLSTTTFHYISPASGCHEGSWYHSSAHDLLKWLQSVLHPSSDGHNESGVRKLCLEMYASELLWLFAPVEASRMLSMPAPQHRHSWGEAIDGLKKLRLNELKIVILGHTCPLPCDGGKFGGTFRGLGNKSINSDGSTHRHFTPDPRWVIKAVLETMKHLPTSAITFSWPGEPIPRSEADLIAGCSWMMLHSTSVFHSCDTLAYDSARLRFWANVRDEKTTYMVPVVWTTRRVRAASVRRVMKDAL